MKYIISESRLQEFFPKLLRKMNIEVRLSFWSENKHEKTITGTVYLYKDNESFGRRDGFDFFYKYNPWSKSLTYTGHWPDIENLNFFSQLPKDVVINFFSNEMKTHLEGHISKGYSYDKVIKPEIY